ncbi:MAG: hypothetical protein ACLFTI_13905, partial [Anaerolineales bacterium]
QRPNGCGNRRAWNNEKKVNLFLNHPIFVIKNGDWMNKIKSNLKNLDDFASWREIVPFFQ